jgi:hypothetical protein
MLCERFTGVPDLEALTNIPSCVNRAFSRCCARRRQWGPERRNQKKGGDGGERGGEGAGGLEELGGRKGNVPLPSVASNDLVLLFSLT